MSDAAQLHAHIDALNCEARRALHAADYSAALQIAEQSETLARDARYSLGIALALDVSGYAAHFRSDYPRARDLAVEALGLYEAQKHPEGQVRMLYLLGIVHRELADLTAALDYHQRQIVLAQHLNDQDSLAKAYNGIGGIYHFLNDIPHALEYTEKALAIYRAINDPVSEARIRSNMLEFYSATGDLSQGIHAGLETEALMKTLGDQVPPRDKMLLCSRMAHLFLKQRDYDRAAVYAEHGLALSEAHDVPRLRAVLLDHMGHIALARGQATHALTYLHASCDLGETFGFANWMFGSYQGLSEAYQRMGDFEQALFYYQRFHDVRLAIMNEEKEKSLRQTEARFQVETARKEAEFYRHQAEHIQVQREQEGQAYERLTQLKDDLLTMTTHDIKNPLGSIKLSLDVIRRMTTPDDVQRIRQLENISRQVGRINALISNLLELAKLETGRTLNLQPHALAELLDKAEEQFMLEAHVKGVNLFIPAVTPTLRVLCDPDRIEQVLENLIGNALKYTRSGGVVEIMVALEDDFIRMTVRDTGLGIPEEDLPNLFAPFYRVQRSEHRAIEGTGLGLAIVKTIIEQHGGSIQVESTLGVGSAFSFTISMA